MNNPAYLPTKLNYFKNENVHTYNFFFTKNDLKTKQIKIKLSLKFIFAWCIGGKWKK